jgi:dihydroorotase
LRRTQTVNTAEKSPGEINQIKTGMVNLQARGYDGAMDTLTIRRPDDWHLHLRDGDMLGAVLSASSKDFARAIIMPNLVPPVVTSAHAAAYRARILDALSEGHDFQPLMTLYLTEDTDPDDVAAAHKAGLISAVKLYPAGATTNSASGVTNFDKVRPVLERMAEIGLPLCVHGEVTHSEIDIFDRESAFIDQVLDPIRQKTPNLRVIMEHITTRQAAEYVAAGNDDLGATITVQHLMLDRNAMLVGGIRPHYYCLPILKRREHLEALLKVATQGPSRYFLGTDSAPHATHTKENACGCAGCFTAPIALSCLAQVFEEAGALDKLEHFTSLNGPKFYALPPNEERITLTKAAPIEIPAPITVGPHSVTVFDPGRPVHWHLT